ncbi:MAG: NUDIX domain-containing protein [Bacteroidia bacterium]
MYKIACPDFYRDYSHMYPFNVRVYGILLEDNSVLLTDEYFHETFITKFPGGGLQFGEGTVDCVRREFLEELNLEVEVVNHFYTTDFFQPSAFDKENQIISIYYLVKAAGEMNFKTTNKKFDFTELKNNVQTFRWVELKDLTEDEMTFPIDKKVAGMLKKL